MKEKLPNKIFVSGIGTGIGKTIASAVLTEALQGDYWKPVQCGNLDFTDTQTVQSLVSNTTSVFHPETYLLKTPSSPHYAARMENTVINPEKFRVPASASRLLIEGAGGLMVPLNEDALVIDLIKYFQTPVILVVKNYLGSINHTLLSLEALRNRNVPVLGVIFNGEGFLDNEAIIQQFSKTRILGQIEQAQALDKNFIKTQAARLRQSLAEYYEL